MPATPPKARRRIWIEQGATAKAPIDATDKPELRRLAEQVRDSGEPVVLQVDGEDVAVMAPLDDFKDLRSFRPTPEQIAATMSAAGAWKGLIDTEQMKRDIYAARGHRSIPEDE